MTEHLCKFVSSRGLLKSCDFHSSSPKSDCDNDSGYLLLMLHKMFDGMSIYVCSSLLSFFVNNIFPKINKKFTLVSGDSDKCIPTEALSSQQFNLLTNSQFLIKWFSQNTRNLENRKLFQLPIGLDYHTILNNPACNWKRHGEGHLPYEQENILIKIKESSKSFHDRIPQIYVNFSLNSSTNRIANDRTKSLAEINPALLALHLSFIPRTENWRNISRYTFVLSPFGHGLDCHRTWEALCLGCIPIVKAPLFNKLFEDLPVLNVNKWSDVNKKLLDETIEIFKTKKFNYNKLLLEHWVSKFKCIEGVK